MNKNDNTTVNKATITTINSDDRVLFIATVQIALNSSSHTISIFFTYPYCTYLNVAASSKRCLNPVESDRSSISYLLILKFLVQKF